MKLLDRFYCLFLDLRIAYLTVRLKSLKRRLIVLKDRLKNLEKEYDESVFGDNQ